ncbi:MAG: PAS domain-containing protein [Anaerolineaceae bacterium]|nr:PAS domain-containing protein [Anaerolineaceae bacterium]
MLPDFRVRQRDYLLEISRALTQELDLDKLLGRILHISIEMVVGQAGLIALRSKTGKWRVHVSHALPPAFLKIIEPYLSEIKPTTDDEESTDWEIPEINRILKKLTHAASLGLLTGVGLPLLTNKMVVGVIFIFRGYRSVFSKNDRALLQSFADQAAIAVQNAQNYAQITQEKQRLDAILESAADGIIILNNDHTIERCNQAFVKMIGMPTPEIIEKYHGSIIRWASPPKGLSLEQAEAGGWPLTPTAHLYIEGDLIRNNELPPIPVGITYAPLLSTEGFLINVIATIRDITSFREADEIKSTFISIVSHELKTPVALIKGYVSTLRREDASWDRNIVQDSLEVIEEEADRLTELIENLLDASRLQAGGVKLKLSDVSLPDISKRLTTKFNTQTTKHEFTLDFPENFPIILADETRIRQVISNLLSNAIKYSESGLINVSGQIRQDLIIICVKDEGPGIAPSDIPFIFERFYRAPDSAKFTKGAGLGLFLTKSIIEAHKGKIWVDSGGEIKGGRICFSLPRNMDE